MGKDKQFENMTFKEIYSFMSGDLSNNVTKALKYCVTAGCLLFPMYFMKKLNVSMDIINNIATGATLAGVGCTGIVGQAIQDIRASLKKTDHQQQYIQCQMVHYMVFFSAIIETVIEIETGNNDSWIEEFKKELKKKKQCEGRIEEDFPVESIFNIEIGEIERNYKEIISELKNHFFELGFWNELGESEEDQREYFEKVFDRLPAKAFSNYKSQIAKLCSDFPVFMAYFQNKEIYGAYAKLQKIIDKIDPEPEYYKRELFYRQREKYYTFFGDAVCSVNNLFFMDNYFISKLNESDEKTNINNLESIVDIVDREKIILVTGPYGSGKTVLLKKLHYRYSIYGENVFAFDAIDLLEILQEENNAFISFFEKIAQDRKTVFLIDGIDDLNIKSTIRPKYSWLDIFLSNIYEVLKKFKNISFILASRLYSRAQEEDVAELMFCYSERDRKDIYIVNAGMFNSETVSKWIDQFIELHKCTLIDKNKIKRQNRKIISALSNPLFLYVFMNKYLETQSISQKEGFYYYYDVFINQTIKGKFYLEERFGANVIENFTGNYRLLLQEIAFDILKKFNTEITSTIIQEKMNEIEPLLGEKLQSSKYIITINDFSEITRTYYENFSNIEIYTVANLINCYFFKKVNNKVFFTDSNILFTLAAERIYGKLFEIVQKGVEFSVEDLRHLDVIDFYPQILDYIIYKIKNNTQYDEEFKGYIYSFVANKDVQNRLLPIRYNPEEAVEDLAQIIMMYIIFFKINEFSFASKGCGHIFKEFMWYVNTYKTIKYNCNNNVNYIYTVERYFMDVSLNELKIKRINLKEFNFQNSNLSDLKFEQCKMLDTRFYAAKLGNKIEMKLCDIKNCNFMFDNEKKNELELTDCSIDDVKIKPRKVTFLRCHINKLHLNLQEMKKIEFKECVINKLFFTDGVSRNADAVIEFRNCNFKTDIKLKDVRVLIRMGKYLYLGNGRVFKNITYQNKIETLDERAEENENLINTDGEISVFYEIHVKMQYQKDMRPCFQVVYNDKKALIDINSSQVIDGEVPEEQMYLILAWCVIHKDELIENWSLSKERKQLNVIDPLV